MKWVLCLDRKADFDACPLISGRLDQDLTAVQTRALLHVAQAQPCTFVAVVLEQDGVKSLAIVA